jgi:hypothetical protein
VFHAVVAVEDEDAATTDRAGPASAFHFLTRLVRGVLWHWPADIVDLSTAGNEAKKRARIVSLA